ncbi:MAG: class I SAM-dependent methyltransferase [Rhodospirillales bacterium]
MSRLDSFIRRLAAQRACLDHAARIVGGRPGVVLEIGLGNGRTYDHLRTLMPGRDIFVFDRQVNAHPDCIPYAAYLYLGDFRDTLARAASSIGAHAVLAHCDIGSGDDAANAALASAVAPLLAPLLADGAVVASDQPLSDPALASVHLPSGVVAGRYHLYAARRGA